MAGSLTPQSNGRRSRRRSFKPSSEINVTPLVDVMLVLLIIFMVTAPILTVGVPVDLPKTTAAQTDDQIEPLVVSIDADGKTYFKDTELPMAEIVNRLGQQVDKNPDAKIFVRGDKKLSYGVIMEVMGEIASAGFHRVSLIAELPSGAAPINNAATPIKKAPTKAIIKPAPKKAAPKATVKR